MEHFTARLKSAREQAGLTQEQLAEKIGVTRQAVSRWEQGITQPDMEMLVALSEMLQVDVEALAFGKCNKVYPRFQKKYKARTIAAFSCALVVLLLMTFLEPYLKALVNRYDFDSFLYFWLFRLLLPPAGFFALGFGAVALVSQLYHTCPGRKWRIFLFILSLVVIAPSLLVLIDDALAMSIDRYAAHIAWALYIRTSRVPAIHTLLYRLFPMVSGVLCFLGTNKK